MTILFILKKSIPYLTLSLILTACGSRKTNIENLSKLDENPNLTSLSGQVYLWGPSLDTNNCEVIVDCDCCAANMLFINEKEFIYISYCVADQQVSKGTYTIQQDQVLLSYDSLMIQKEYNYDFELDTTATVEPEFIIRSEKSKGNKITLTTHYCNKVVYLQTGTKEIAYGIQDNKTTIEKQIQILKKEGIWEMLY